MESRLLGFPAAKYRSLALRGGTWARELSCSNTGTVSGHYKKNLEQVLSDLSKAALENGVFRTSTAGTGADQVRGSLMCFVDHDQTNCLDCLANSTAWITRKCPNSRTASASYGACLLEYSSPPFFDYAKHSYGSDMNTTFIFMSFSHPLDGDTSSMANARSRLFEDILRKASNQKLLFYNESRRYNADKKMMRVYGLAQCRGDLPPGDCSRCIFEYNGMLRRFFPKNNDGIVKGRSCYVRFQPSRIGIFAEPMPPSSSRRDPSLVLPPPYAPPQGPPLPLRPSYSHSRGQDSPIVAILLAVVMTVVFTLGMGSLLWWGWRKAKAYFFPNLIRNLDTGGKAFSYQELVTASNRFSTKLGEGHFGAVYEGIIGDSKVAIKKLTNAYELSLPGFEAEVTTLSRLNHRNVVQLIGWCCHKKDLLLIYELVPNGSLHTHLDPKNPVLPWHARYKIVLGLARALEYIHENSNDRRLVIHKDIKPQNIMIGESFNPKLGDFGLAAFLNHDQIAESEPLAGTTGYMDYFSYGKPSAMSDMFAFGVVLLVIASGRPAVTEVKDVNGAVVDKTHIKYTVSTEYGSGHIEDVADPRLEDFVPEQMKAVVRVGLRCVSDNPEERPTAKQVIELLPPPMSWEDIPARRNDGSGLSVNILDAWSDSTEGTMSSPLLDFRSRAVIHDTNSDGSIEALNNGATVPSRELPIEPQYLVEQTEGLDPEREGKFAELYNALFPGNKRRKISKKD